MGAIAKKTTRMVLAKDPCGARVEIARGQFGKCGDRWRIVTKLRGRIIEEKCYMHGHIFNRDAKRVLGQLRINFHALQPDTRQMVMSELQGFLG